MLDVSINSNAELTIATPWVPKPVILSSSQLLHVIFLRHTFVAAASLGILGAARWYHGREKQLYDNEGTKHAEKEIPEKQPHGLLSFRIVSVSISEIEARPEFHFLPPPLHLLLHHPLLHPHARPPLLLHLLIPPRVLIPVIAIHILSVMHQPLVSLSHLIELFGITPIVRVQLFGE